MRIAGVVPESVVDGPGIRYVVFTQGCPHHCPECHNPETHDFQAGEEKDINQILIDFQTGYKKRGMTISGGEPFCQAEAAACLAKGVKLLGGDVVVFSGFTFEALLAKKKLEPGVDELLRAADILIDGPYQKEQRDLNLAFRGSKNQRIIDLPQSLAAGQAVEINL